MARFSGGSLPAGEARQRCCAESSQPASGQDTIRRSWGKKKRGKRSPGSLAVAVGHGPAPSCRRATDSQRRLSLPPFCSKLWPQDLRIVSWPDAGCEPSAWLRCRSANSEARLWSIFHVIRVGLLTAVLKVSASSLFFRLNQNVFDGN